MIKPITPSEAGLGQNKPDFVIKAFNEVITKNFKNGSSRVTQEQALAAIQDHCPHAMRREDIFAAGWLDVEPNFRAAGWRVEYDKPGYCEDYGAFYIFSAPAIRALAQPR
jgi:hypothetical protein